MFDVIIAIEMVRSILRKKTFKSFLFLSLISLISAGTFHVFAQGVGDNYVMGGPPPWCPPPEHPGLSSVCGTVRGSQLEVDGRGNYMPNLPKEGITVAIYEENPLTPTGKVSDETINAEGALSNIFASTSTNSEGRYHIVMRKVGPPMVRTHLVFLCGSTVVGHKELDSWHDYWEVNEQVNCPGTPAYTLPGFPQNYVDRSGFLGCFNDPVVDIPTGLSKNEQPTVNNIGREDNYDHRYNRNTFSFTHPFPDPPVPPLSFESPGGLWEPDCLLRKNKYLCNAGPANAAPPAPTSCDWNTLSTQPQIDNRDTPLWYAGYTVDGELCEDPYTPMQEDDRRDYITRPFFMFIPKIATTTEGYRRFDIRVNLENYIADPLIPLQWMCKFWGCSAGAPSEPPHVFLRKFMQDNTTLDLLPDCEELNKRNNAYKIFRNPERNKQLNGGPFGGMASPSDDLENAYYASLRDLSEPICVTPTRDQTNPVRLCEIQPTWSPAGVCTVGTPGCNDPEFSTRLNQTLSTATDPNVITGITNALSLCTGDFVLGSEYFPTDAIFRNQASYTGMTSRTANDSQGNTATKKPVVHEAFDSEDVSTHESGSRAVQDPGGRFKGNSALSPESVINLQMQVPGAESMTDPFTIPYADVKVDYLDEVSWGMADFGTNQIPKCTIGNPFSYLLNTLAQESDTNFHPDNIYRGNLDHVEHRAVGTGTFYPSLDSKDRDIAMGTRTFIGYYWGVGFRELGVQSDLVNIALNTLWGRDVWDSILSIAGGDTNIHNFTFDIGAVLATGWDALATPEHIFKTFGDRDPSQQTPFEKPYYEIEYPVNEANFTTFFELPSIAAGDQLLPTDWGPAHVCYAFDPPNPNVPEGEVCGTYREDPDGISRTCRVDECIAFWQVESQRCECTTSDGVNFNCDWEDPTWDIDFGDCDVTERLECAFEQETTPRSADGRLGGGDPEAPNEIIHDEDPDVDPGNGGTHDDYVGCYNSSGGRCPYDPPSVEATHNCTDSNINWSNCFDSLGVWICGTITRGYTRTTTGDTKPRCDMSVAGPLKGGIGCNATLTIGDVALRYSQQNPYDPGDTINPYYKPQVNLDDMYISGVKLSLSFRAPYHPAVKGSKKATLDARTTNSPMATEYAYTYGAELDTGGWSDYANIALIATPPVFDGDPTDDLAELFYHCDTIGSFTPIGANDPPAVQVASMNVLTTYDPELGLAVTDTDGDGVADAALMGWQCPIDNEPVPPVAELSDVSNNCTVDAGTLASCGAAFPEVPDLLSETFRIVINNAATRFDIPAGALIAILANEGGFASVYHSLWADDLTVQRWSLPYYGRMDVGGPVTCIDMVWSAQGPYQFLKTSFDSFLAQSGAPNESLCAALNEISPGRCLSASRCNFLDASYAAARHMQAGGTCGSFNFATAMDSYSGGSIAIEGDIGYLQSIYNACN
ncbi:hypothetical protein C4561_03645 [candidate division WWE3 bacterium]|jgi:hypothetical protein|uniref:Uncharacterized protein n=1 Tax=candidate division WWE3 bacterium TaxID=2053526 RepID=A0A3A4ZC85_UNCKA|nr:MAG: hypothetical protein C4561_03645 [candidate division WWE3 bacterium]